MKKNKMMLVKGTKFAFSHRDVWVGFFSKPISDIVIVCQNKNYWNITGILLEYYWNITGILLEYYWNITDYCSNITVLDCTVQHVRKSISNSWRLLSEFRFCK
jgi:hypothetical protein